MRYSLAPAMILTLVGAAFGQNIIVTAEGHHGAAPPQIKKSDITVELANRPAHVEEWTPLQGDRADLDLFIAIDDGVDTDIGNQFNSLKSFIAEQPASTRIGLAYLRNGEALIASPLTSDRLQLGRALRLPLGQAGISASPYVSLSDLTKKWPATGAVRREVLVISNGIDPYSPADPLNPYLDRAIQDAQRGGIVVHSIYYAGAGHLGHNYFRINWGENYLAEIGDATGGEAYWQGYSTPVLFDSFLKDLNQRLKNQYLLTFTNGDIKSGLQPIRIVSTDPEVSVVAAKRVLVGHQVR